MNSRDVALTVIGRKDPAMAKRVRQLLEVLATEGPTDAEGLPQHLRGGVLQCAEDAGLVRWTEGLWRLSKVAP